MIFQMILVKYQALYVIFEKAAKFENVVSCKLKVVPYGLKLFECQNQITHRKSMQCKQNSPISICLFPF